MFVLVLAAEADETRQAVTLLIVCLVGIAVMLAVLTVWYWLFTSPKRRADRLLNDLGHYAPADVEILNGSTLSAEREVDLVGVGAGTGLNADVGVGSSAGAGIGAVLAGTGAHDRIEGHDRLDLSGLAAPKIFSDSSDLLSSTLAGSGEPTAPTSPPANSPVAETRVSPFDRVNDQPVPNAESLKPTGRAVSSRSLKPPQRPDLRVSAAPATVRRSDAKPSEAPAASRSGGGRPNPVDPAIARSAAKPAARRTNPAAPAPVNTAPANDAPVNTAPANTRPVGTSSGDVPRVNAQPKPKPKPAKEPESVPKAMPSVSKGGSPSSSQRIEVAARPSVQPTAAAERRAEDELAKARERRARRDGDQDQDEEGLSDDDWAAVMKSAFNHLNR